MKIEIKELNKSFNSGVHVLKDISFSVDEGEIISILGPSGCGKSTILRILAELETADSGTLSCKGKMSFVFQESLLLDWRSALDNVTMPLEILGESKEESQGKALDALKLTGLGDKAPLYPNELSGGMKMRVSLARALVTDPEVILLDEPFAALDEMTREKLNEELIELNDQKKLTLLLVTHNIFEAVYMSDRIIILSDSPAEIRKVISVNLPKPRQMAERGSPDLARLVGEVQKILRTET